MAFKSWYIKRGRLRLYDGSGTPYFLEVSFRGQVRGPIDRPRPAETLVLDRMRLTAAAHYVQGSDEAVMAPLPLAFNFRLANTEPNLSKFVTLVRSPAVGVATKAVGPNTWVTTKGTSQLQDSNPEGRALVTTPTFSDPAKWCADVELLYEDPDGAADRGFRWNEVYFPPNAQLVEGDAEVVIELAGEVYGAIDTITAFTAGTES